MCKTVNFIMLETTNKHQKKITGSRNFGVLFWELGILFYSIISGSSFRCCVNSEIYKL